MIVDIIGMIGVMMAVITYLFLQMGKVDSKGFWYSFLNAFGSMLILYSLTYNWNLASFFIEFFWIGISLYGLLRWYVKRMQNLGR